MPDHPTPSPLHDAGDATIAFIGWFDSSLDLMRGLTVTEWGQLDEAPTERRAVLMPEAAARPLAHERRGHLRVRSRG